jgi:hypothetical protein
MHPVALGISAGMGGWLGHAMLGGWWAGGLAGGLWGGLLGWGATACVRRATWRPIARFAAATAVIVSGFFLFVVAAGAVAAVLGLYRASAPLSSSPSHLVTPQVAIAS